MRHFQILLIALAIFNNPLKTSAQRYEGAESMFLFYEDNDFINVRGHGTDKAYTNGIRMELFYKNKYASSKFINRWMPKAGNNSVDTYKWGIMQIMYTPTDISKPDPDPRDYSYAGALYGTRSLHSANSLKRFSFQTDFSFGVIGPHSFAKETQIKIHKLIANQVPMGWDHQLPNRIIANLNFTFEKELLHLSKWLEWTGGARLKGGSMINALSAYSILRIGKMNPYFDGYISRYKGSMNQSKNGKYNSWQVYALIKPEVEYQSYNAILSQKKERNKGTKSESLFNKSFNQANPNHYLLGLEYGLYLTCQHTSISLTQKIESPAIIGVTKHEVGNISFYSSL